MPYAYPTTLDDAETLLASLGSFWATSYGGADVVRALCDAKLAQQRQAFRDGRELVAACSRLTVPVDHAEDWYALRLAEADLNPVSYSLARYGEAGRAYGTGTGLNYGEPVRRPAYAWTLPAGMTAAPLASDRITGTPNVTLVGGIDYVIDNGLIVFRGNPFDDARVTAEVDADGARSLTLFVAGARFDRRTAYRQFGYALGLDEGGGPAYRDLVNAMFDGLVTGSTARAVRGAWSAATGVPMAGGDETVELVDRNADRLLVVTDAAVYRYHPAANPLVAAGDAVVPGQALTDALAFDEFNRGQCPSPDELKALALGRGQLASGFFGDLTFRNAEVPLVIGQDADGRTRLSWELGGWPGDVERFFDELHARGLAAGRTLAELLDSRPPANRDGEPGVAALPATINPLKFLCENVLRDNAFLVRVRLPAASGGVGMNATKFLRRVVPPQTLMIVVVEFALPEEAITMDGPFDGDAPGYEESPTLFRVATAANDDVDGSTAVDDGVPTVYSPGGRCI